MKRFVDLVVVLVFFPIWLPIILAAYLAVFMFMGRPIFFVQERPGVCGMPFMMYKFRSMKSISNGFGGGVSDDERLTDFGRFLRSTSLDELPSLLNIVKGDMSLVGPRPLLMEYLPLYTERQRRRHEVRPGITGWAQVNGRNALSWEEKFELDVWYVENQSFWLDMKILVLTLKKVLLREGISAAGEATMPKFTGSKSE